MGFYTCKTKLAATVYTFRLSLGKILFSTRGKNEVQDYDVSQKSLQVKFALRVFFGNLFQNANLFVQVLSAPAALLLFFKSDCNPTKDWL
jgi:hypothetical protein